MAAFSYSAFHHLEFGADLNKKRQELLSELYNRLKKGGFKKAGWVSSSKWTKDEHIVEISSRVFQKEDILSKALPHSKPFKPYVLITVVWDRNLGSDSCIQNISKWLQEKVNN